MPHSENPPKKAEDDALRKFIDKLERWPEDEPPTPAELRAIRKTIHLSQDDQDKLKTLVNNHIKRARAALAGGAYSQAAAELARAAQLRPLDNRPRVELARIYLQRSLDRDYGRQDRQKAVRLARKALELNPRDPEAREFLQQYRRMNIDFISAKSRRFIAPLILLVVALAGLAWWQRDRISDIIRPNVDFNADSPVLANNGFASIAERNVPVNAAGMSNSDLNIEFLVSSVGRRNDSSFVHLVGRLEVGEESIGRLTLLIRGRDQEGQSVFTLPWLVRDETAPVLIPGDSEPLAVYRWLSQRETNIAGLELVPIDMERIEGLPAVSPQRVELVWDAPRPEGSTVKTWIRSSQIIEAFDRQVVIMDLVVENTGIIELTALNLGLSYGSQWTEHIHRVVEAGGPSLAPRERRVRNIAISYPLDADLEDKPLTVRVKDARR